MSNKRYARRDMLKARGKKLATARGLLLGLRQRPDECGNAPAHHSDKRGRGGRGMKMHLRYNMMESPNEHPQKVMRDLGITYQHSTPQSMGDQWWFWNCENCPEPLPEYLEPLGVEPLSAVGYGLSKEDAEAIILGQNAEITGQTDKGCSVDSLVEKFVVKADCRFMTKSYCTFDISKASVFKSKSAAQAQITRRINLGESGWIGSKVVNAEVCGSSLRDSQECLV